MNVMLTLIIIPVSAASDNRKCYCHRGIAFSSFVMDLLLWLPRQLLSSLCLPLSLSHTTTTGACFMGNGPDPCCAGELGGFVWVFAFGGGRRRKA